MSILHCFCIFSEASCNDALHSIHENVRGMWALCAECLFV